MQKKKNNLQGKKILAFIPARGGSKGLPNKNILKVGGVPLIAHTIQAARRSRLVARSIVSTDSTRISAVAKKHGGDIPFLRPAQLAKDTTPIIDAVLHALAWLKERGEEYDALALLEPTSPLRKKDDIDNAIKILIKNWNKADAVVSLGEIALESPFYAKKIQNGFVQPVVKIKGLTNRRQDLPKTYFPYGVVYLCKTKTLLKEKTFYPKRVLPYLIERWQNYEIDDIYGLVSINAIIKKKNEV